MMKGSDIGSPGSGRKVGGRFWRGKKLGSQDYSLDERIVGDNGTVNGDGEEGVAHETSTVYRTYKRRWIGLATLTLMNIVVSWDVSGSPLY
jgi:hypothetical protein